MNRLTRSQQGWLVALTGLAVALLLAAPALRQQRLTTIDVAAQIAAPAAPITASQRAALARDRQRAQILVAEIAVADAELQSSQPDRWASSHYQRFVNQRERADSDYTASNYAAAVGGYSDALASLAAITALRPERLRRALQRAEQSYNEFALEALGEQLELAELLIEAGTPDQRATLSAALARQPQLPATLQRVNELGRLIERGEIDRAEQLRGQPGPAIDTSHPALKALLSQLSAALQQRELTAALHNGHSALSAGQLAAAESAFKRAQQIDPTQPDGAAGLALVVNQRRQQMIDHQLARAEQFEQLEQWQQAVDVYQQLQADAPGLVEAQVRLLSSGVRAALDLRWQQLSGDPFQLVEASYRREALQWLADARSISPRGERLDGQIEQLQALLSAAQQRQRVVLLSNGETEVTLFKVAQLGRFQRHTIELLPGAYTALGSCRGRRDRQVAFTVGFGSAAGPIEPVHITCGQPL